MAGPDPRRAGLDPAHILAICERAAASGNQPSVRHTLAVPAGLSVRLSSPQAAQLARAALARVGYQAALARPSRRSRNVLVAGWSAAGLESRLAAMRATVHQLRAEPAATATAVIDRYRRLSAGLPGIQASAAALSQAEKQIRLATAARCGIHAPRDPAILPADTGNALRLRVIWALEQAIDDLIERHLRVTRRALAQFCSLRRHGSDDWASDTAIRRAVGVPSAPPGGLVAGRAPTDAAPPLWPRQDAGPAASGEARRPPTGPGEGRRAALDFPVPISAAVAATTDTPASSTIAAGRLAAGRHHAHRLGRSC